MHKQKPIISVLILSYNHASFIKTAIQSALKQATKNLPVEVIVLDDGSNDGTDMVLKEMLKDHGDSFRYIQHEHEGVEAISKNFNILISQARGEYISFLASDDEYTDSRFLKQVEVLNNNKNIEFVYGNGINSINGVLKNKVIEGEMYKVISSHNAENVYRYITHNTSLLFIQSILIRKSFLRDMKPFDEDLIADDWVFNINCFNKLIDTKKGYAFIDEICFIRNILPNSASRNLPVHLKRIQQVIERYTPDNYKKRFNSKIYLSFCLSSFKTGNFKLFFKCMLYYFVNDPTFRYLRKKIIRVFKKM